ncbi:S8 family serine peptidase [bacterium]|nr:S8 family serine peptidase [bacterium]
MPVRVLGEDGGSVWDIAAGIRYAVDNGAHVINLSLGGDLPSPTIASAIQYAAERNVAIAIAAGNSGGSTPLPPADLATTWGIAVGAVDLQGNVPSFSNRAGSVPLDYVVAPGVSVYSTLPNQGYGFLSGTSMATPHVAGVAALVRSANPYLTAAEVEHLVATTANAALVA